MFALRSMRKAPEKHYITNNCIGECKNIKVVCLCYKFVSFTLWLYARSLRVTCDLVIVQVKETCKIFKPADTSPAARFPYNPKIITETILWISLHLRLIKNHVNACAGTI